MKGIHLLIVWLLSVASVQAQQDTTAVLTAVNQLQDALVKKDSVRIQALLHTQLAFGHSNGWVQGNREVLEDMRAGFLVYQKIENLSIEIKAGKKFASVRQKVAVEGTRDGVSFKLNLFVLQTWVKEKGRWKLLSRQSARMG